MNAKEAQNRDEKLSIYYLDDQGRKTLDLIRLADIFSRTDGQELESVKLADLFNRKAEKLCRNLAVFERGGKADRGIKREMRKIALLARDNGIERIILPVSLDRDAGQHLVKDIMYGENFSKFYNVQVDLQTEAYQTPDEVSALGERREEPTRTALDYELIH